MPTATPKTSEALISIVNNGGCTYFSSPEEAAAFAVERVEMAHFEVRGTDEEVREVTALIRWRCAYLKQCLDQVATYVLADGDDSERLEEVRAALVQFGITGSEES